MGGYDDFKAAASKAFNRKVTEFLRDNREEALDNIGGALFKLERRKPPNSKSSSPKEDFFDRVTIGFLEIEQSLANLQIIPEYLRRFPFRGSKFSKVTYLRYHLENYLQELYILRNRIEAFLVLLDRYYRKEKDYSEIQKVAKTARELLALSFDDVTKLRGHHTHRKRFADDDLIRLSFLEIVADKKTLGFLFYGSYRNIRKSKLEWIKRNNQLVKRVLDACFQYFTVLVFDHEGEIRYPRRISK